MAVRRSPALTAKPSLYTAQDVARFCEVDLKTVHHWADKGKVAFFRTEGRHLRFRRNDIVRFLRAHGYPLPDSLSHAKPSVSLSVAGSDDLAKKLSSRFTLQRHATALAAIAHLLVDQPDALIVAIDDPSFAGARSINALKSSPETAWIVVCAIGSDEVSTASAKAAGADLAFTAGDASKLPHDLAKTLAVT
jgi:excisionase family DNA binding protein